MESLAVTLAADLAAVDASRRAVDLVAAQSRIDTLTAQVAQLTATVEASAAASDNTPVTP